jgi:hypothetical protein
LAPPRTAPCAIQRDPACSALPVAWMAVEVACGYAHDVAPYELSISGLFRCTIFTQSVCLNTCTLANAHDGSCDRCAESLVFFEHATSHATVTAEKQSAGESACLPHPAVHHHHAVADSISSCLRINCLTELPHSTGVPRLCHGRSGEYSSGSSAAWSHAAAPWSSTSTQAAGRAPIHRKRQPPHARTHAHAHAHAHTLHPSPVSVGHPGSVGPLYLPASGYQTGWAS